MADLSMRIAAKENIELHTFGDTVMLEI